MSSPQFKILWTASGFTPVHPDVVQEIGKERNNRLRANTHRIVRIAPSIVVKYGLLISMKEAENMRIMAKNTAIPLPKVLAYGTFGPFPRGARRNTICDGEFYETYIYMTLIQGKSLEEAWGSCSRSDKRAISRQLTSYHEELRNLVASYIGSIDSGPVLDMASPSIKTKGPFRSEARFNAALTEAYLAALGSGLDIRPFVGDVLSHDQHKIHFAHANIKTRHIMVHNGRVTGILDWALAGFYPEYWEFAKAIGDEDLGDERTNFIIKTFPQNYALDHLIHSFITSVV